MKGEIQSNEAQSHANQAGLKQGFPADFVYQGYGHQSHQDVDQPDTENNEQTAMENRQAIKFKNVRRNVDQGIDPDELLHKKDANRHQQSGADVRSKDLQPVVPSRFWDDAFNFRHRLVYVEDAGLPEYQAGFLFIILQNQPVR